MQKQTEKVNWLHMTEEDAMVINRFAKEISFHLTKHPTVEKEYQARFTLNMTESERGSLLKFLGYDKMAVTD